MSIIDIECGIWPYHKMSKAEMCMLARSVTNCISVSLVKCFPLEKLEPALLLHCSVNCSSGSAKPTSLHCSAAVTKHSNVISISHLVECSLHCSFNKICLHRHTISKRTAFESDLATILLGEHLTVGYNT